MAAATNERALRIHQLDHHYQEGLHRIELVNRDETERRLSLKVLALRDVNAALEDLLSEKELHMLSLRDGIETLKIELSKAKQRSCVKDSSLEKQQNEIRSLKADIEKLVSSAKVSNGEVQDKATLTRDLNDLRSELEQLKSQLISHQAVVAANGDLRRQVDTLEVELDNERRSKLRAQQADDKSVISDLRSKLEKYENKFQTEGEEKNGLKRELAESRGETDEQKRRFNDLGAKPQEARGAMKAAQVDLQQSRCELSKRRRVSANLVGKHQENISKSRQAQAISLQRLSEPRGSSADLDYEHQDIPPENKPARALIEDAVSVAETSINDVNIHACGDENISEFRRPRRRGTENALLGEKSNFSITPFLSKSKDVTDYPDLTSDKSASEADWQVSPEQSRATKAKTFRATSPLKTQRAAAGREKRSTSLAKKVKEAEAKLDQTNLREFDVPAKSGPRKRARLGKVTGARRANAGKDDSDSDVTSRKLELNPNATIPESGASKEHEVEGRRRKRKLLGWRGKTMFDDDEMIVHDKPGNPLRPVPANVARSQGSGASTAFASHGSTFSPLKKERRGANASFIG